MELLRSNFSKHLKLYLQQSRQLHLLQNKSFIDNKWVSAESNNVFPVLNPALDCVITEVPDMKASDVTKAIQVAADSFQSWKEVTANMRSKILRNWFALCEKNTEHLAQIITAETGKPLEEARSEVSYGNSFLEWFAGCASHLTGENIPSPWPNKHIMITREPLGVVSVITPWNFPHAMITRKVGALMAAGCTCVIKPSEDTPLTALALAKLAEEAKVPKGVVNVVTSSRNNAPEVGAVMCQHRNVQCISFTGSTPVGKILYGLAAKGVKRVGLELGGNAPFIVFPSADMDKVLQSAMLAKFRNNGQACVGANRFLVHTDVYDKFVQGMKDLIANKIILGPGDKKGITCGPLVNQQQLVTVSELVDGAVKQGAKVLIGGKAAPNIGKNFYESTLLVNIKKDMTIFNTEIFGPVLQVLKINSEKEAVEIANDTNVGLAAYVFTRDLGQAFRVSKNLKFGMVGINEGILSTADAPFGGVKESGIGREGSLHGAEEYTDIKYTLIGGLDQ